MSSPSFAEKEPRETVVTVRLTAIEHAALRAIARREGLIYRGEPNVAAVVQLALAHLLRYAPLGWRPAEGSILPRDDSAAAIAPTGTEVYKDLTLVGVDKVTARRLAARFRD